MKKIVFYLLVTLVTITVNAQTQPVFPGNALPLPCECALKPASVEVKIKISDNITNEQFFNAGFGYQGTGTNQETVYIHWMYDEGSNHWRRDNVNADIGKGSGGLLGTVTYVATGYYVSRIVKNKYDEEFCEWNKKQVLALSFTRKE